MSAAKNEMEEPFSDITELCVVFFLRALDCKSFFGSYKLSREPDVAATFS